jgi:hypothetical protein
MSYDMINGKEDLKKEIFSNKDDLYNLSVRKKVAEICSKLIADLTELECCYKKILEEDSRVSDFITDNKQIIKISENIFNIVSLKTQRSRPAKKEKGEGDIRLYICALLSETADGILALLNIINIRRIERELIYASEIILRQLIYILPYKIQ